MRQSGSNSKASTVALAIVLVAAGLLAVILYWSTLGLPLIYDDLLHIRITGGLDLLSVWLPTQAFGFYRPLTSCRCSSSRVFLATFRQACCTA